MRKIIITIRMIMRIKIGNNIKIYKCWNRIKSVNKYLFKRDKRWESNVLLEHKNKV